MVKEKIRIGVLGCANIAERSFIPAILKLPEKYELVAIASRSMDKASDFADKFGCKAVHGYENLFSEKLDAVYLPLPTGLNHKWVIESLQAGLHVIAEKSLALSFEICNEMVTLAKKNDLLLIEDFMFRYHSQHKFVFEQLSKGTIGDIRLFRSNFGFPPLPSDNFRYDMALGGGALLDAGAYTIKASSWFLDESIRVINSNLHRDKNNSVIYGTMAMQDDHGLQAQVGFGFDNYYQCNYEIWGSKGKITVNRAFTPGPEFKPTIILETQTETMTYEMQQDNHFIKILDEFYRAISENDFQQHYQETLLQSKLIDQCNYLAQIHEIV